MTERTERMIRDIFACDETLGDDAAARVIALLKSGATITVPISRIWTREEVAKVLNKSLKAIDWYAKRGYLVRVNPTGTRRSIGFTDKSVRDFAEGRVQCRNGKTPQDTPPPLETETRQGGYTNPNERD